LIQSAFLFGIMLAKGKAELRKNGRAETIRATGAVLIDSVLLYFYPNTRTTAKDKLPLNDPYLFGETAP
jgi:hypothetical protein